MGSLSLLQGIFLTQDSNPGLPHCRWILYQFSHKGILRVLEWVAYPFSSGSSWSRNRTRVSCIAGRFFTNWAIREHPTKNDKYLIILIIEVIQGLVQAMSCHLNHLILVCSALTHLSSVWELRCRVSRSCCGKPLKKSLRTGKQQGKQSVESLPLGSQKPNQSVWCRGKLWWFKHFFLPFQQVLSLHCQMGKVFVTKVHIFSKKETSWRETWLEKCRQKMFCL